MASGAEWAARRRERCRHRGEKTGRVSSYAVLPRISCSLGARAIPDFGIFDVTRAAPSVLGRRVCDLRCCSGHGPGMLLRYCTSCSSMPSVRFAGGVQRHAKAAAVYCCKTRVRKSTHSYLQGHVPFCKAAGGVWDVRKDKQVCAGRCGECERAHF